MTSSHPTPVPCQWFSRLASALDHRSTPRLALLFLGAVLARGRRTVTSLDQGGRSQRPVPVLLLRRGGSREEDRGHLRLPDTDSGQAAGGRGRAIDGHTRRYTDAQVWATHPGAGVHHNPTPGPASSPYDYGRVFVVLALLVAHPAWGVVALPLLARLYYARKVDMPRIDPRHRPEFRTRLGLAVELLQCARPWLGLLGLPIWMVADGAYAKADVLKPTESVGMTVVSRLRCDEALWSLPPEVPANQRGLGRPRVCGTERIILAKRAGQRRGWPTGVHDLYGEKKVKRYKTFLATRKPAGGVIRVVLVDEPTGWATFLCTDASASVADILSPVANPFSLEITFRECKQIVGAGQQQVRFVWANIGAFHFCLWTFTMTEAWAWHRQGQELVDRKASPWDDPERRPSHADIRRAWRRTLLCEEIRAVLRPGATEVEIQATADRLLSLVA